METKYIENVFYISLEAYLALWILLSKLTKTMTPHEAVDYFNKTKFEPFKACWRQSKLFERKNADKIKKDFHSLLEE